MKNINFTQLDTDQIIKKKFDEEHDAERVFLVGGQDLKLNVDSNLIAKAVKEGLSTLKLDQKSNELQIIEKNVFIPKIETIEVPIILREIEYKIIEIEKFIEVPKIIEIEKPVIIKETQFIEIVKERDYPFILKLTAVIQAICVVSLLLINLLKK